MPPLPEKDPSTKTIFWELVFLCLLLTAKALFCTRARRSSFYSWSVRQMRTVGLSLGLAPDLSRHQRSWRRTPFTSPAGTTTPASLPPLEIFYSLRPGNSTRIGHALSNDLIYRNSRCSVDQFPLPGNSLGIENPFPLYPPRQPLEPGDITGSRIQSWLGIIGHRETDLSCYNTLQSTQPSEHSTGSGVSFITCLETPVTPIHSSPPQSRRSPSFEEM